MKIKGKAILSMLTKVGVKNGSTVLTVVAGLGVVATAIFAAQARPKADENVQKAKEDKALEEAAEKGTNPDFDHVKLTVWEIIKAAAPAYVKAIAVGVLTIACVVGSHVISVQQIGDLAAAYSVTKMANDRFEEYEKKVKEVVGEEKESEIKKAANEEYAKKKAEITPYNMASRAIHTGLGNQLFYDPWSDRYFYATKEAIREAVNTLNFNACGGFGIVKLNDFYDELNLANTRAGDMLFWEVMDNYSKIEPCFSGSLTLTEDGFSYVIMDFDTDPKTRRERYL